MDPGRKQIMSQSSPFAVIADASRLGGQLLHKILEPLVDVSSCEDPAALQACFSYEPAPQLLLISHDWPQLASALEMARQRQPALTALLLISPDTDRDKIPGLKLAGVKGTLTRPYQARDVINGVVRAMQSVLAREMPAPPTAMEHGPSLSAVLERDLAFCKRHGLMLSTMAVQLNDYQSLCREIGNDNISLAQAALEEKIRAMLRHEDGLCLRQPGLLVYSLPGTPPLGARVLAHRLCAWLDQQEIHQQHFNVHFSVNIGIHCNVPGSDVDVQTFLADSAATTLDLPETSENHVHLSDYALTISGERDAGQKDKSHSDGIYFWKTLDALLKLPEINDSQHQEALMQRLAPLLAGLPEQQRLQLVDDLLMASVNPDAG